MRLIEVVVQYRVMIKNDFFKENNRCSVNYGHIPSPVSDILSKNREIIKRITTVQQCIWVN